MLNASAAALQAESLSHSESQIISARGSQHIPEPVGVEGDPEGPSSIASLSVIKQVKPRRLGDVKPQLN